MSRPWMPLYVADYLADTAHLRAAESGAYLHLIMHYWLHGGLPNDDRLLATIARMTTEEWRQCRDIVVALFQPGWRHKRIDKELAEAATRYERRASAGRKGAKAKHCHQNEPGNATAESSDGNAVAVPVVVSSPLSSDLSLRDNSNGGSKKSGDTRAREAAPTDDWPKDYRTQFWLKYPNKVGKPKALAKLDLARKRGVPWGELWGGLLRYAGKTDDRPWCNPQTWINEERWTDEPSEQTNGSARPRTRHRSASAGADFFAGLSEVAASIGGNGAMAGPAHQEVPLGRVNIDG